MMSLLAQPLSPRSGLVFGNAAAASPEPKDRPFACEEPGCGRRFNRKFTLSEHKKTHTGEKPYVCPLAECARRFSTSGNLARHKRLHASLKPFECDINGCKRSFPSQEKLDHHIKIHTGRRTHVCRVPGCTKAFSTAGNLSRHIKNRHPELIRLPTFHYSGLSLNHASPQLLPAEPLQLKLEPVPPVFSPDSVELSSFQDELSAFQMACEPPVQLQLRHAATVDTMADAGDIARCSMSLLDEVIEFELTKDV